MIHYGNIRPLSIKWEHGRFFKVDKTFDVRLAVSLKAAGTEIRHTCKIMGKQIYLLDDEDKWFVERANKPCYSKRSARLRGQKYIV